MDLSRCYKLGYLAKAHGVKGEIRAVYDVSRIDQYKKQESVFLLREGKLTPVRIVALRILSETDVLLQLEGVLSRNDAEALQGTSLYLPLESLPPLRKGQFYYHEILGYTVQDARLGTLGTVNRVLEMPGQDLIVMEYQGAEVLIPVMDSFVPDVDRAQRLLLTTLPDGLVEVYLSGSDEAADA